jgi:hypothetical protein
MFQQQFSSSIVTSKEHSEAQQEGHQDGANAAYYEKVVREPYRVKYPLTLEHAKEYPGSYGCVKTQEDVDAYNAAFKAVYDAHKAKR